MPDPTGGHPPLGVSLAAATSAMVKMIAGAQLRGLLMVDAHNAGTAAQAPAPARRPRILVADTLAPEGLAILEARADVAVRKGLSERELIAALRRQPTRP